MQRFAQLFLALEDTNKTNDKVQLLVDYFNDVTDEDKLWTIALFSHRRPRGVINTRQLRELVLQKAGMPSWLFEESYQVVGDLAETLSMVLPPPTSTTNTENLSQWIALLLTLGKLPDEEKFIAMNEAIACLQQREKLVFFKILTGGFRVGVSQLLMQKALAIHTGLPATTIAHRLMGDWHPNTTTFAKLITNERDDETNAQPYPFCLAHGLDKPSNELGNINDWFAEWKWDGIRAQLIIRAGNLHIWSRGEELITEKFPEFEALKVQGVDGIVIDGELMPFKDQKPLPFALLQTRIGRKNLTKKNLQEVPVTIIAYDLLEYEGRDIRNISLAERRQMLTDVVGKLASPLVQISPLINANDWTQLGMQQQSAREHLAEGLMLKAKNSPYGVGRRRGDWWKWKVDPLTIDAVLVYAQKGHGKRADIYSDFTFAVWQGNELVTFAKAYSGLSDVELREVSAFVSRNTVEKFGPVRTVKPELVFEIAFEGIQLSARHKSGVAVRFPRILRWRKDKGVKDANTISDLKALLSQYGQ